MIFLSYLERFNVMQRAHCIQFLPQPTGLSEALVELSVKKDTSEVTICSLIGLPSIVWPANGQDSEKSDSAK